MKNLFLLSFTLCIVFTSFAQDDNLEHQSKNTIFLESYKPVITSTVKYYDNDRLFYQNFDEVSRDFNEIAIGIGFERMLKNNIILRPRIGLSVIDLKRSTKDFSENDFNETYNEKTAFVYEQSIINLFLGLSKRIQLNDKFNIDFGFDLSVISYLEGTSEYYTNTIYKAPEFGFSSRSQDRNIINYGEALSYGIGPIIKPAYKLKMGLSFSFEIQYYFMNTISKSQITQLYSTEVIYTEFGMETENESSEMMEAQTDFSDWSWSEFSPLIRVGYSF